MSHFFLTNITPLFFVETLADLEKEIRNGRTPEQVIGNLAYKTPDLQSRPNVHHHKLLYAELAGKAAVEMRGRPIISGGIAVALEGQTGVYSCQTPEEEALHRWQRSEFLDLERQIAGAWRQGLSGIDFEFVYESFKTWYATRRRPDSLVDVRNLVSEVIEGLDQERILTVGLSLIGVVEEAQAEVVRRWRAAGRPEVRHFAPYFTHVISVDLFFYLSMAADLVSRERPSHKIDLAYLYYLPFCAIFTSSDKLHARMVPLFLRDDQSFVPGVDLKSDLSRLDRHYSGLPEEVKRQGLFSFASYPPQDGGYLVTQLWDRHAPGWRERASEKLGEVVGELPDSPVKILERLKRLRSEAKVAERSVEIDSDDADQMVIERRVLARKGKWRRFPPEVEKTAASKDEV